MSWIWSTLRTGFRQQMAYRQAMALGAVASAAFAVIRVIILHGLYANRHESVSGLSYEQTVTWAIFAGMLFTIVWVPWMHDFPQSIRSGEVVTDLLQPVNPFMYQLARQGGRMAALILVRVLPFAVVAIVALPVPAPRGPQALACLAMSLVFLVVSSIAYFYVLGTTAFFTSDYHVWLAFAFYTVQLIGGVFVPIEFIPGVFGTLVLYGPGMAFIASPTRIANNIHPVVTLLVQFGWTVVFCAAAYLGLRLGRKRLVMFGG